MNGCPVLVVGDPTIDHDVVFGQALGPRLGGTGAIAALALARLGNRVAMAGRIGPDLGGLIAPLAAAGVEVSALPAAATLRFENIYADPARPERREQRARRAPGTIRPEDLERLLARPLRGVLLGPLTPGDLAPEVIPAVLRTGAPVAIDVQGFLREVGADGAVRPRPWPEAAALLPGLSLLHAGDDEAADLLGEPEADAGSAERLSRRFGVETVAVTRGGDGAWIWSPAEGRVEVPAFRLGPRPLDPTGCGDIFLAAFFHGRLHGWDTLCAGRFASMAAALNAYSLEVHCAAAEEVDRALAERGVRPG